MVDQECGWEGMVRDLAGHLAESCALEPVECPNAAAGCSESVPRRDVALHASETCDYREISCGFCDALLMVRDLLEHHGSCPQVEVECPFPGCEERMAREEVEQHVASSGAVHLQGALTVVAGLEHELKGAQKSVDEQKEANTRLKEVFYPGLACFAVFSWTTSPSFNFAETELHTFAEQTDEQSEDGVIGYGFSQLSEDDTLPFTMGFCLTEGPAIKYDMHIT